MRSTALEILRQINAGQAPDAGPLIAAVASIPIVSAALAAAEAQGGPDAVTRVIELCGHVLAHTADAADVTEAAQ